MDPSLSDARIHQLVFMAIQAVLGMGGLYLLLAPKPGLLKFAESYYLIRRFGKPLGNLLSYERKDGSLMSVPPIWQVRLVGLILTVFSLWCLITSGLNGAA